MRIYEEPCSQAESACLYASLFLFSLVAALYFLGFRLYMTSLFLVSTGIWLTLYRRKVLVLSSNVGIGWVFARLVLIPFGVTLITFMTLGDFFSDWAVPFFDLYLSETLLGVAKTASSLEQHGFKESAETIKAFYLFLYPLLLVFGGELIVAALCIGARISKGEMDISLRIRTLKNIPLYTAPFCAGFILAVFYIDFFSPGCRGRRCGLESGYIFEYLFFSFTGLILTIMATAAAIYGRMIVTVLMTKYRYET